MSFYIFDSRKEAEEFARNRNCKKSASWYKAWVVSDSHSISRNVDDWMVLREDTFNYDKAECFPLPKEVEKSLKIETEAGNRESQEILKQFGCKIKLEKFWESLQK